MGSDVYVFYVSQHKSLGDLLYVEINPPFSLIVTLWIVLTPE